MTEREAFIEAIAANPYDDTARLAFADWLQENGEEDRAEFVRLSLALAAGARELEYRAQLPAELQRLQKRILALLETRGPTWLEPFCRVLGQQSIFARRGRWASRVWQRVTGQTRWVDHLKVDNSPWRRWLHWGQIHLRTPENGVFSSVELWHGFVMRAAVRLASESPIGDVTSAFRSEPVNSLSVRIADRPDQWRRLNAPCLARIQQLAVEASIEHTPQTTEAFEALLRGENWSGVRDFGLWCAAAGADLEPDGYVTRLSRAPLLSGLETLSLDSVQQDLTPLVSVPHLASLRSFFAWDCRPPGGVVGALRSATFRANLQTLRLASRDFGDADAWELASAPWPKLDTLDLEGNQLSDVGVRHLLPLVPQLTDVSLCNARISDAGALALMGAIDVDKLACLSLSYSPLSEATVNALRAKFGNRFWFHTSAESARTS